MHYKKIFENTYSGKKVLLTGHTGFKGSWLLLWLHHLGAMVRGYALEPEHDNDLYNLVHGDRLCQSVIADIRNPARLKETVITFQPDFIFHLAAQPFVRRSYKDPLYTFEVNVTGTAHVLEAVRDLNKPCCVVMITTDKVYQNIEQDYAYRENDPLGGYDPYSASKAAAEIVVNSYRNSFFNSADYSKHKKAIATARAGNVIGGGDRGEDRLIPDIIRGLEKNETIIVRNPASVRPWQHVLEPISGYLLLGTKMSENPAAFSTAWNFGPHTHDTLTVNEVVEKAIAAIGQGSYESPALTGQPHEATLLKLDISKALQELGWQPKLTSSQAIEWTMHWYKQAAAGNVVELALEQIRQYQEL